MEPLSVSPVLRALEVGDDDESEARTVTYTSQKFTMLALRCSIAQDTFPTSESRGNLLIILLYKNANHSDGIDVNTRFHA